MIKGFEELECWQACRELRIFIAREVVPKLPADERFRLADQLLRAARSTTANIAEGYGRRHYLDNAKFIRNSLGSAHECLDHIIAGVDEGLLPKELLEQARELFESATALCRGYATYLQRKGREV